MSKQKQQLKQEKKEKKISVRTKLWYQQLLEDLKNIKTSAKLDIIKRKHEVGERIYKDPDYQENIETKKLTRDFLGILATDLGMSKTVIWECIMFYRKFPDFSSAVADGKNWSQIRALIPNFPSDKEMLEWMKVYDVWNFSKNMNLNPDYPGSIPIQIIMLLMYYYTKENDLVVDPFSGGGITIDACNKLKRKYLCYDIAPSREEIKQHDISKGFPKECKEAKLIFLDPPYWTMKKDEYIKESVSSLSYEDYIKFIEKLAKDCYDILSEGGKIAFIIQNQTEKDLVPEFKEQIPWTILCYDLFKKAGFKHIRIISAPQNTSAFASYDVSRAKKSRRMLGIYRDVFIMEKPKNKDASSTRNKGVK